MMRGLVRQLSIGAIFFALGILDLGAHGPWETLKDCRYLPNPSDDGDSFHIRVGGKETIFRLYFVDAPETEASLKERLDEQAKYFGITIPATLKVGEAARTFTREKLRAPFTVRTCHQDALGRSRLERFYAFVETKDGDLSEDLVRNGLARLHGESAKPPGLSAATEWGRLQNLERQAKQQKIGAWGVTIGRLNVRAEKVQKEDDTEWFDKFFHPEKVTAGAAPAITESPAATSTAGATPTVKLDVNTATLQQLDDLPGIGPVLAQSIISARPFKSADDLRNVKGIGDKRYEKIRSYFQ